MSGFIQIAGIRSREEAEMLVEAGADALGFPFRLDHHAEDLPESEARRIIAGLPEKVRPVLITYLARAEEILDLSRYLGVRGVQLHGEIILEEAKKLKSRVPNLWLIKSLVVRGGNEEHLSEELMNWAVLADAFLTDTYDPESGASGATGMIHDWGVSRRLAEQSPKPLLLAGGLNPGNVATAIAQVRPWGVDVHTGVEDRQGWKDRRLVENFIAEARRSFAKLSAGWGSML
ncbi:MAG TPA: phosphoribosylanthranilate isomerase [bacterium]|nr:phosphoribosylanthranilate isomerase [bacterium]